MHSVLLRPGRDEIDRVIAELWELGTCGILEEASDVPGQIALRAFFEDGIDTSSLSYVEEVRAEPAPVAAAFPHDDWEPLLIGQRFFIAPSWVTTATPPERLRLTVDSVTAFGTGRHETTQLMLEALESLIEGGETVLDIGCGSGILSAAASLLGASRVVACDIDALAVQTAVTELGVCAFTGSADALRDETADILLVNISAKVIDSLAPELRRILKPDGRVLLTGFLRGREPESFLASTQRELGGWVCLTGTRNGFRVSAARPGRIQHHAAQWW